MSDDASSNRSNTGSDSRQHSLVADVAFNTVAEHEKRPTSARGNSLRLDKERWSARGGRLKDRFLTPPKAVSSRKSEEVHKDKDKEQDDARSRTSSAGPSSSVLSSKASGKQPVRNGSVEPHKARSTASQASSYDVIDSPARSSLQGRGQRMSKSPSVDPAQLVQMALNLSESRKRHSSNPSTAAGLRPHSRLSTDSPAASNLLDGLRSEQFSSPASSDKNPRSSTNNAQAAALAANDQLYFSPATLARAEKARRYFELADKHRRLLQQLPPAQQSGSSTGRARAFSRSSIKPRDSIDVTQSSRQYNPLQALRNRKARQQAELPAISTEPFTDLDGVEQWLSQLEGVDRRSSTVALPILVPNDAMVSSNTAKGHRRTGTTDTVITKPVNEWSISPAELLADTYWTEQGQNNIIQDTSSKRRSIIGRDRSSTVNSEISQYPPILPADDPSSDKIRHNHLHLLPLSAANRLRQHKFNRRNRSASASSASSTEDRKRMPNDLNIGPLQRHMDEMIRRDAGEEVSSTTTQSPDHWDTVRHRHKSIDHRHGRPLKPMPKPNGSILPPVSESNKRPTPHKTISSPESSYPASPIIERASGMYASEASGSTEQLSRELSSPRSKMSLLNSKTTDLSNISEVDFGPTVPETIDPTRLSVEAARPATFRRHRTTESISSSLRDFVQPRSKADGLEREPSSAVGRLFRGGRDMVRNESSKIGNRFRGRDRRGETSDVSAANTDASEDEDVKDRQLAVTSAEQSDVSPRASLDKARPRYQVPHLPSFRSPRARETTSDDHISRQQAELRKRNRSPRFERLAPPRIDLPDGEKDDTFLELPTDKSDAFVDRRQSYGFLNPALRNRSRSHSKSRSFLGRGRFGQQPSGTVLSPVSTKASDHSRQWSISDKRPPGIFSAKEHGVTSRDVARVRALLLASGIKAREISRRLGAPSAERPGYLLEAARLTDMSETSLERRPQHEESVYAMEILSSYVDNLFGKLSSGIETFQRERLQELITRQDKLKARVAEDLTELVHAASDQADAFNIELSTQATLRTKHVDDVIDAVLRLRRRQFRWLRIAAFKMLELVTLSLLWSVWFVVVCFKTVQRIIWGLFRFIRWLLIF